MRSFPPLLGVTRYITGPQLEFVRPARHVEHPILIDQICLTFLPGIPHKAVESDVYRGYHIPKGAIVIPNIWFVGAFPAFEAPARWLINIMQPGR